MLDQYSAEIQVKCVDPAHTLGSAEIFDAVDLHDHDRIDGVTTLPLLIDDSPAADTERGLIRGIVAPTFDLLRRLGSRCVVKKLGWRAMLPCHENSKGACA